MEGIPQWYAGRSVFITGATGFMGKVLLEKLLRSCPDIKTVYILCRSKRGLTPKARLTEFTKLPVFNRLREENPEQLKKIEIIEGDIIQPELGIKEKDIKLLQSEVSVVFNGAASLKLEAELKDNVEANTRGTQKLLNICLKMKKLVAVIHFSTAFCHPDQKILEEKIYSPPANPHDVLKSMEWLDEGSIKAMTPKLLGLHPNSYTYTKRLTETLVDEYSQYLPVVIIRPSIVLPSFQEPVKGWVDSLNGPVGVLVGAGKGVVRSMMCGSEYFIEVVPVDIAINSIIIAAYKRGIIPHEKSQETKVYNVSCNDVQIVTWGEIIARGKQVLYEYPMEAGLWYPNGQIRSNRFIHYLFVIFTQLIPAYLVDGIMVIIRQKRFLVRVQNRIWLGMHLLEYFTTRNWSFKNKATLGLHDGLNEADKERFFIHNIHVDINDYMKDIILGARQYCLKEPLNTLPKARKQLKFLFVLDKVTQFLFICLIGWILMKLFVLTKFTLEYATYLTFSKSSSTNLFMKT